MTDREAALVLAAHGSHESPEPRRVSERHADRIRAAGFFGEVREGYWKGTPSVSDAVRATRTDEVVVVPLFMSEGYFAGEVIPREIDAGSSDADVVGYTEAVGTHPRMTEVVRSRAEEAPSLPSDEVGLAVVGHGTGRHPDSSTSAEHHADDLADVFDETDAVFLDEEPHVSRIPERFTSEQVVAVPLFVADGPHSTEDVPRAMGISPGFGRETIGDVEIVYTEPVGTHPDVADVVVEQALDGDEERGLDLPQEPSAEDVVKGFHMTSSEEELLSRVEDEGVVYVGEVAVQVTAGERSFEMMHAADIGSPKVELEAVANPLEMRRVAERDGDGRYRANLWMKGLDDGWLLDGLHERETVAALEVLYPGATRLRSTDPGARWRTVDAAELSSRHPKMCSHLEDAGDAVDEAVERTCDRGCVRRRIWGGDTSAEGEGSLACLEPCSVFVSRVRRSVEEDEGDGHGHEKPDIQEVKR